MADNPHCVYGVDAAYILPALVSIYSLHKNASRAIDVTLYLEAEDLESHDLDLIDRARDQLGIRVSHKLFDDSGLEDYSRLNSRFPVITLLPLVLPRLVEGRCLFLDADTLVVGDVATLLDLDMTGCPVGACAGLGRMANAEPFPSRSTCKRQVAVDRIRGLGFVPRGGNYFNTGVVVMDCPQIRELPDWQSLGDVDGLRPFTGLPDQDRMNQFFHGRWYQIPVKWNLPSGAGQYVTLKRRAYRHAPDGLKEQLREAIRSPMIWHYLGGKKPWKGFGKSRLLQWTRRAFRDYARTLAEVEARMGISVADVLRDIEDR